MSKAMKKLMALALSIFRKHWGHDAMRPQQEAVIAAALDGKDAFAVLPTGYGKTMCFQIPAMMMEGTALVISPLIALMKDQCDDAQERGIAASFINSHVDEDEAEDRMTKLQAGEYSLFYIAPERLRSKTFQAVLRETKVSYLVVDEAHCASRWGHDFRPAYMKISKLLDMFDEQGERPPIIAVTATATPDIEEDIVKAVGIDADDYERVIADPVRPNLTYQVKHGGEWTELRAAISRCNVQTGRHIFYSATRGGAEKIQEMVEDQLGKGVCGFYHAGMRKEDREQMQDDFKSGKLPIIAATCAFGMGIDVPNIRSVVHFGIPLSLEDYVQEAGRAGRDCEPSDVVCISSPFVEELRGKMVDSSNPPYEFFEILWGWLHANLAEGDTMFKSAQTIARELERAGHLNISPQAVTSTLSTMESKHLIERGYAPSGTQITVNVESLFNVATRGSDTLSKGIVRTLRALWTEIIRDQIGDREINERTELQLLVDTKALTPTAGVKEATIRKHLRDTPFITVERAFSGKTTRIPARTYEGTLTDLLPREDIELKRARALARLAQMIEYTRTADREGFIRSYFQHGVGTPTNA